MGNESHSYASLFLEKSAQTLQQIRATQARALDDAIELLFEAWQMERWVYVFGNGGSASSATHLAGDLIKTVTEKPGERGIAALTLVDNIPLCSAMVNDWGWENLYVNQLATLYRPGGVGIALSVHGGSGTDVAGKWSQNVMKGLQYIKEKGGKTIGFSGFDGGPMKDLVDVAIVVPANSTPLVEGFHVVLDHLIVFGLKERIASYRSRFADDPYASGTVF